MSVRLATLGRALGLWGALAACGEANGAHDAGHTEDAATPDEGGSDAAPGGPGDGATGDASAETDGAVGDAASEGGDGDAALVPSDPPELRSVQVDVQGALPISLDLSSDARWVLPDPAPVRFTVFAQDDEDDRDTLRVQVVDTLSGAALTPSASEFASGLWQVDVTVEAGSVLEVHVGDSSGNTTRSAHSLTLPSQADALVGQWQQREYDVTQKVAGRIDLELADNSDYQQYGAGASDFVGGTYRVQDGELRFEQTVEMGGDEDSGTVEQVHTGAFYVDLTYFSDAPYLRSGEGSGLTGTWMRRGMRGPPGSLASWSQTLTFNEDSTFVRETTEGGTTMTESGGYVIEPAASYTENFGDFLAFSLTEVDGASVAPVAWLELYNLRAGRLLLSPHVATE